MVKSKCSVLFPTFVCGFEVSFKLQRWVILKDWAWEDNTAGKSWETTASELSGNRSTLAGWKWGILDPRTLVWFGLVWLVWFWSWLGAMRLMGVDTFPRRRIRSESERERE
jgi:hypothetical protein